MCEDVLSFLMPVHEVYCEKGRETVVVLTLVGTHLCLCQLAVPSVVTGLEYCKLNGSVKEPNILIYFFFRPSLNRVLFPMFCLWWKASVRF